MIEQDKRITIQDIAKRANVSISTVSRVLSGNAKVAEDKHLSVMQVIEELNYRPNALARGLASGRSMTIGVITQNIGSPFYDGIMGGIIIGFEGSSYTPIFMDGRWRSDVEIRLLETLLSRRVDGLIIVGGHLPSDKLNELIEKLPIIIVAREMPQFKGICLCTDNFQAAYDATTFLIQSGHRSIAHIGGIPTQQDAIRRREGYMKALQDAGIEIKPGLIVEGNFVEQSGVLAIESLFARGQLFSAIFSANDQMAFGARLALYRKGIRVPDDISIVGFDDEPVSAYMTPPLTTIHQPALEMGKASAEAISRLLNHQSAEPHAFSSKLIIRESVGRIR